MGAVNARRYGSLWERLVANTAEPDNGQACWEWTGQRCTSGYGRVSVHSPARGRNVKLSAHLALWCWMMWECASMEELFLAYTEMRESGLHLDHLCVNPACVNPDHLDPTSPIENYRRRGAARRQQALPL